MSKVTNFEEDETKMQNHHCASCGKKYLLVKFARGVPALQRTLVSGVQSPKGERNSKLRGVALADLRHAHSRHVTITQDFG